MKLVARLLVSVAIITCPESLKLTVANFFEIIYRSSHDHKGYILIFKVPYHLISRLLITGTFILVLLGLSACVRPLPSELYCITEKRLPANVRCKEAFLRCDVQELICCAEQNDVHAQLYLGQAYLTGWKQVKPDFEKAAYWFHKAADCGLSIAQVQLGHLYRDGVGVPRSLNQAICWYEKAAAQGDISAMLALGELYKGRYCMKPNYCTAMKWFQMAANLGSYEGELQVAWLLVRGPSDSKKHRQALDILVHQANLGNPNALTQLGDYYFEGYSGCCDLKLARENYERAACIGSAEAMFKLGMMYVLAQGVERDYALATEWITKSANGGYLPAEMYLADMYRDGRIIDRNYKLAAYWYWKAAERGSGIASIELADLVHAGKGGLPRDLTEAARLYELGAVQTHHPYPELMLSVLYAHGRGVPLDLAQSVCWYNRASCETGFALAEYKIGRRYALGFGLKADLREALRWYRLAAACCLPLANIELGDIYYRAAQKQGPEREWLIREPGFPKILEECALTYQLYHRAYLYYQKAAAKCHPYAQYMMGIMELDGKGVPKNWHLAVTHIRKAAYQGAREAQYQLGLLYLRGIGVQQSDTKAYGWLKIALEEVTDITPEVIVFLIDKMNPCAREQAVKLAAEYECKYQPKCCIACPRSSNF